MRRLDDLVILVLILLATSGCSLSRSPTSSRVVRMSLAAPLRIGYTANSIRVRCDGDSSCVLGRSNSHEDFRTAFRNGQLVRIDVIQPESFSLLDNTKDRNDVVSALSSPELDAYLGNGCQVSIEESSSKVLVRVVGEPDMVGNYVVLHFDRKSRTTRVSGGR